MDQQELERVEGLIMKYRESLKALNDADQLVRAAMVRLKDAEENRKSLGKEHESIAGALHTFLGQGMPNVQYW